MSRTRRSSSRTSRASEWLHKEELIELLGALRPIAVGLNNYTQEDRAHDFIAVFGSEAGRRVLAQINTICQPITRESDLSNHGVLAFREGRRSVLIEIQRCFMVRRPVEFEERPDPRDEATVTKEVVNE